MMAHRDCEPELRRVMREFGAEIDVFLDEPAEVEGYNPEPNTCPHGTTYWTLPTEDQRKQWMLLDTVRITMPDDIEARVRKKKQ